MNNNGILKVLWTECHEYVVEGSKINIVNPQSTDEHFGGKYLTVNGERKLDLTRLDYLGLGSNPKVREVMIDCIKNCDISCPASQMVMKTSSNIRLERALADLHGMKESLVFTSGYATNENIVQALGLRMNTPHLMSYFHETGMGKLTRAIPTIFFIDEESHFSLQRGARMAKVQARDRCIIHRFSSLDYGMLADQLEKAKNLEAVRVIVSDTLSSTSGRIFDIGRLCELAEKYDCLLYLDEAHSIGAMGPDGKGIAHEFADLGRYRERTIIMGTLTKVFCQLGGYATMSNTFLCWFLRVCSPQYIFSAPVPPWMAETLIRMIELIKGSFGEEERKKLKAVSSYMRAELVKKGFNILGSNSHIIPIAVGDDSNSARLKAYLERAGFVVSLFIFPAVPRGSSLVRFSLCSDITMEEVDEMIKSLKCARDELRF